MEKIDNLKLALDPKTMELIVTADVIMKHKDDFYGNNKPIFFKN